MQITAAMVKELRERTGSGMMECKKALQETQGDIEAAVEHMRKTGLAKADKKGDRVAAEGYVAIELSGDGKSAAVVEVNCETDFVGKGDEFQDFAKEVAQRVLKDAPQTLEALLEMPLHDGAADSIDVVRKGLVSKIGENIQVRRFERLSTDGSLGSYQHGSRIGVLVDMSGAGDDLLKDIAMHIAASKPICVSENEVPEDVLQKERDIFAAQAAESGKPAEIIEKMVQGRIRKYLAEITLVGQPFVKDPDQTVGKLLKDTGATVNRFVRFEVGEGIEKKQEDFAAEVMAQVSGS